MTDPWNGHEFTITQLEPNRPVGWTCRRCGFFTIDAAYWSTRMPYQPAPVDDPCIPPAPCTPTPPVVGYDA